MVADGGSGSGCLARPTIPLPAVGGVSACMVIIMDHGIMVSWYLPTYYSPGLLVLIASWRRICCIVLLDGRRRTTSIRPPASSWFVGSWSVIPRCALCLAELATRPPHKPNEPPDFHFLIVVTPLSQRCIQG